MLLVNMFKEAIIEAYCVHMTPTACMCKWVLVVINPQRITIKLFPSAV